MRQMILFARASAFRGNMVDPRDSSEFHCVNWSLTVGDVIQRGGDSAPRGFHWYP
jgi:hypothetical protein